MSRAAYGLWSCLSLPMWDNPFVKVTSDLYRKLPSIDQLLRQSGLAPLLARDGQAVVTEAARVVLSRLREEIAAERLDAAGVDLALSGVPAAIERQLRQELDYSLRPVINATGVILHTNLGRAPLAAAAQA